jgi:hypothetical protein
MKRVAVGLGVLLLAAVAYAAVPSPLPLVTGQTPVLTQEVLVLTTATAIPALGARKAVEIQNLGPNSIFCALTSSSAAVVNKARKIAASETWALDVGDTIPIYCIAATAAQVTGAATVVTQVR